MARTESATLAKRTTLPARERDPGSYSIQSVYNALDVLEALCEEEDEVRISHLSEKLGMNKTSVFRLLATFEKRGYVEREKGTGKYRLGLSAYETGQKILSRMGLLRKARPVMERLARETNEAVYLTVRRGSETLFLEVADTLLQVKIISLVGRRFPLEKTASGLALLAFGKRHGDRPGRRAAHEQSSLAIFDPALVRERGVAVESGGIGEGIITMATPLFASNGDIVGCLCLVGPDFRLGQERIETELLPRLKDAGEAISSKLGYLNHYLAER